jgi:hypothetical protein
MSNRKIWIEHVEVLNETEQVFVFMAKYKGATYGDVAIVNMVMDTESQDRLLRKAIRRLEKLSDAEAKDSEYMQ